MAYNLQSLITILEQILNPQQTRWIVDENKPQLQSLLEKSVSLQQIFEETSLSNIESLESEIRDAAHKAEDMIESHMVDRMLSRPGVGLLEKMAYNLQSLITILKRIFNRKEKDMIESHMVDQMFSNPKGVSFTFPTPDLQQVMQQLDSVMEQVVKLVEEKTMSSSSSSSGESSSQDLSSKSIVGGDSVQSKAVVGVDEDMMKLKDRVMGMQSKLAIVPIVGMGGIGKTTLARKLYQDPSIVEHFTYLSWSTVSQDYNMKEILLSLLRCIIGKEFDQHAEKEIHELKDILYHSLYGRRYIVVLDDIWSIRFWDEIRMYLPDNNKGSRIVITTRLSEVSKHVSSQSEQHQMQLLHQSESWNLLRQTVFGEEGCPDFLQAIGKKIASHCGGLPLAINVIGGLLSKVERSTDVWESIAKNVASAIAEADEQFFNILSLSYSHLPNQLKPCFLYMGAFPEDYEIKAARLICIWIAEGFVKSHEVAKDWLKSLVERNLLLVAEYKYGKPKSYKIHDLLRDLCIRKSNEDEFLYVKNGMGTKVFNPRRVCAHASSHGLLKHDNAVTISISLVRSFVGVGGIYDGIPSCAFLQSRLLKVLLVVYMDFEKFPTEILELVNLRFLAVRCKTRIPSGISRLKNLQTLIAKVQSGDLTYEIFEMPELRHLRLSANIKIYIGKGMENIAPNKLQAISRIRLTESLIRRGFLESILDISDLGIFRDYNDLTSNTIDLTHLHKLERLRIYFDKQNAKAQRSPAIFKFPCGLRRLALHHGVIFPRVTTALSALPNLEVLKIEFCEFESEEERDDQEWEVGEGVEFLSLQFLHLQWLDLVSWKADETNFPRLRHLSLMNCWKLEEIPSGIGEIPTLQSIELKDCSRFAVASARQIVEEQQSEYGNYHLKLHITS